MLLEGSEAQLTDSEAGIQMATESASSAIDMASTATELASIASDEASLAKSDALNAAVAANTASSAAIDAISNAFVAQDKADQATLNANTASLSADKANSAAGTAAEMASNATSDANDAKSTAVIARSAADTAQNVANAAQDMASSAGSALLKTLNEVETATEMASMAKQQADNNKAVADNAAKVAGDVSDKLDHIQLGDSVAYGDTAPANPVNGTVWYDTSSTPNVEKVWDAKNNTWVIIKFTAMNIAAQTITADELATGAITTDKVAAGAIDASKIQAGTITGAQIAAHAITADQIEASGLLIGGNQVTVPVNNGTSDQTVVSVSDMVSQQQQQIDAQNKSIDDGITTVRGEFSEQISTVADNLNSQLNLYQDYIRIQNGEIIFGNQGNDFNLTLALDGISFERGSIPVAKFTEDTLAITDARASLQLGNFAFQPRNNGNLTFTWIGGKLNGN